MPKSLYPIIIAILLFTISHAQKDKGSLNVQLGFSLPDGDYASKSIEKEEAGFALSGVNFDISYSRLIEEKEFGYSFTLRAQTNPIDVKTITEIFSDTFPFNDITVESEKFEIGSFLVGGFYSMGLNEKTFLNLQLKMGFSNSKSPSLYALIEDYEHSFWSKQESADAISFAYLVGARLNYSLNPKLYLLSTIDYFGTKPEFSNVEVTSSDGSLNKTTFEQPITAFNLGVGVGFKL